MDFSPKTFIVLFYFDNLIAENQAQQTFEKKIDILHSSVFGNILQPDIRGSIPLN